MRHRLLTSAVGALIGIVGSLLMLETNAWATAQTGYVKWFGPSVPAPGYPAECAMGNSIIADVADNKAFIQARVYSDCVSTNLRPSGWLGALAPGYRDGYYCGQTGWHYSSSSTATFGVGGLLCSNPSGTQTFWTSAQYRYWFNDSTAQYELKTNHNSPNQNY